MVNKRLEKKKTYISPAVEVIWVQNEGELMKTSVTASTPDQRGESGYGNNPAPESSKANRFSFVSILDSYDDSSSEVTEGPDSGFELPEF